MHDPITQALKKLIPQTCLPTQFRDHQELADALVVQLSGDFALVPKGVYDAMVGKIRRYDQLRKNLPKTEPLVPTELDFDPLDIVSSRR